MIRCKRLDHNVNVAQHTYVAFSCNHASDSHARPGWLFFLSYSQPAYFPTAACVYLWRITNLLLLLCGVLRTTLIFWLFRFTRYSEKCNWSFLLFSFAAMGVNFFTVFASPCVLMPLRRCFDSVRRHGLSFRAYNVSCMIDVSTTSAHDNLRTAWTDNGPSFARRIRRKG